MFERCWYVVGRLLIRCWYVVDRLLDVVGRLFVHVGSLLVGCL